MMEVQLSYKASGDAGHFVEWSSAYLTQKILFEGRYFALSSFLKHLRTKSPTALVPFNIFSRTSMATDSF